MPAKKVILPTPRPLEKGIHKKLNDEPTIDEDIFDQETAANRLASQLATVSPPAVFGLHGDWGSGKTSFLNRVHKVLTNQNRLTPNEKHDEHPNKFRHCVVVWFEAWRYQHDEAPVVALLNEIRAQFTWQAKFRKTLDYAGAIAFEAGLRSLDGLTSEIAQVAAVGKAGHFSNLRDAASDWKKENLAFALPSQATRDLLNKAITATIAPLTKTAKPYNPRVIIIVDDLDRCQPYTAYKFLEGIKIFLGIPSCVFLLGINREEIVRSVSIGMRREEGVDAHGSHVAEKKVGLRAHEYLEKLCGHIEHLPFLTMGQSAELVFHLLRRNHLEQFTSMSQDKQNIVTLLRESDVTLLPANPRRIKSFVNCLLELLDNCPPPHAIAAMPTVAESEEAVRASIFILIASLSTFHPAIYRILISDHTFFEVLKKWCRAEAALTTSEGLLVASARLPCTASDDFEKLEGQFIARENGQLIVFPEMPQMFPDPASPDIFRVRHILLKPSFQNLQSTVIAKFLPH